MNIKQKSKIFTINLILVLTISTLITALPTIFAQEVTRETYPFINAVPNPAGLNQEVLLHLGITHPLALQWLGWEDLTVTVTKPDGSTETLGPFTTDSTGGTGTIYIPTQIGVHLLQTHFPEQKNPIATTPGGVLGTGTPANATMLASDSEVLELVVQQDPILTYPGELLPTEFWDRPIDANLREWAAVSGSWLMPGRNQPRNVFAPYNDGPETAHVLWTKPHEIGGITGGEFGGLAFDLGDAYSGKWEQRFVVAGILIYELHGEGFFPNTAEQSIVAVDIQTGEELWTMVLAPGESLAWGQLMNWDTFDQHGIMPYFWTTIGSTWNAYDPFTARLEYTLTGVPGGTQKYGPKGEILRYQVNNQNGWMALWNSTNIPALYGAESLEDPSFFYFLYAAWYPWGKTVDATGSTFVSANTPLGLNGYSWNVSIPTDLPGSVQAVLDDRVIGASFSPTEVTSWGLSIEKGQEGTLLFKKTWIPPASWVAGNQTITFEAISSQGENGVFVLGAREARRHYGFSTDTGDFLWETDPESYLNWYGAGSERPPMIAYGKMYASGISGTVYAYDLETGDIAWTYDAVDPYQEFLFSNNWWMYPVLITDGKIYYGHLEHSPINPRPRGGPFICLNATTGEEIWRINGAFRQSLWGGKGLIADSIIVTQDTYDQRIYGIGKGPTEITVNIQDDTVKQGESVMVKGSVFDVSPGTNAPIMKARFPSGVPAIADEYMSDWMLYVYKQHSRPVNAEGVEVRIQTVDPDGTYAWIGTVKSDSYGNFAYSFIPQTTGTYTVIVSFVGSDGYYGSQQTTHLTVDPAPQIPAGYPGYEGPSAQEVANNVVANLPDNPTSEEISQAVISNLPEYPEQKEVIIPEYTTIDIVLAILVIIAILIGILSYAALKK